MSKPLLELHHVTFRLPNQGKTLINHVSLQVATGDFVIVLGENGAGKSTLFKLINQHLLPSQGNLRLNGRDYADYSRKDFREKVVTLAQDPCQHLCLSMTINEHLILHQAKFASEQERLHYLDSFHPRFPQLLHTPVMDFSGGEKQLFVLALALLKKPELLLLDEHTSALDPKMSDRIMQKIKALVAEHQVTCLMITHQLQQALDYGDSILVVRQGQIAARFGAREKQVLDKAALVAQCYG